MPLSLARPACTLFAATVVAVLSAAPASAQDATQDLRLRLLSNDAVAGGTLAFAVEVRTSADRAPNTTLGSATVDVRFDADHLAVAGATRGDLEGETEYAVSNSLVPCGAFDCIRLSITSSGVGTGGFDQPGVSVGTDWFTLQTYALTLDAESAGATALLVYRPTLSIGYYDTASNSAGNGVIEDNTRTVGDDYVAFETVSDLAVRTVAYPADAGGSATWHLVGAHGEGAAVDSLVGPLWTQGFSGSDAGAAGGPNVVFYDETAGTYAAPASQSAAVGAGVGLFVYAFADADNDGADEGFPQASAFAVDPVRDLGGPVNNTAPDPDPYAADLPFGFAVTYTASAGGADGPGWNLLSNPTDGTADWDDAGWTRTNVSDALYTWDADHVGGAQYVSWMPGVGGTRADGALAPNEGFWAQATGETPELVMPASAYEPFVAALRTADAKSGADEPPPRIRLAVSGAVAGAALSTETVVAFAAGAEAGHDRFDTYELTGPTPTRLHLFTRTAEGQALDLDARPPLAGAVAEVGLEVSAVAGGSAGSTDLVLTWPEVFGLDAGLPVSLLDTETGEVTDLRTATQYAFSLAVTESDAELRAATSKMAPARPALAGPLALGGGRTARRGDGAGTRFVLFVGAQAVSTGGGGGGAGFALAPPAPNPSRGTVQVAFTLDAAGAVRLAVYDALGRTVQVLAEGPLPAGPHEAAVAPGALAPGVYLVRLEAGGRSQTQRLTVVR